jgi:hypothetical protein
MSTAVVAMRKRLRSFNRAAMSASPIAAYARLHLVAPLALVAVAAMLLVGLRLPDARETGLASTLIKSKQARQEYGQLLRPYERLEPKDFDGPSSKAALLTMRQLRAPMLRIAESQGLRCTTPDYLLGYDDPVACDSHYLAGGTVLLVFWLGFAGAVICLMLWLFVQFRESWMLPRWSGHLWFTPIYAVSIAAIGGSPFLMIALYHSRATHYALGASEWRILDLGVAFYLLVVLQLATLCVAAVELRPSAVRFVIGTPVLAVIAGIVCALAALGLWVSHVRLPGPYSWLAPVVAGVLAALTGLAWWLRRRRRAFGRARAPFSARVLQLSAVLLVAWAAYAADAGLAHTHVRTAAEHGVLRTAILAACAVHLLRSRSAELRLPWLPAPSARGIRSAARRSSTAV